MEDSMKCFEMSMDDLIYPYDPPSGHNKFDSDEGFRKFFHHKTNLMKHLIQKYVTIRELKTFGLGSFKKEKPKSSATEEEIRKVFFRKYQMEDCVLHFKNRELEIFPSSPIAKVDEAKLNELLEIKKS